MDSATSLIQAAKNLMNAVVLTVKASYVASTKYTRIQGTVPVSIDLQRILFKKYYKFEICCKYYVFAINHVCGKMCIVANKKLIKKKLTLIINT